MKSERKSVWTGIFIGMLLVWGLAAPPAAYYWAYVKGYKDGVWYSGQKWKEAAGETAANLRKNAAGATTFMKDSVTSAKLTLTSSTSVVAASLGDRTTRAMAGLGGSLTSATAVVTSYTAELGEDLKEGAEEAGTKVKAEARWAKDAVERRTNGLVSGMRRRVSGLFDRDKPTTGTTEPETVSAEDATTEVVGGQGQ